MEKAKAWRVRFQIQSLSLLGLGIHKLPINCWRLTVNAYGAPSLLLDGQNTAGNQYTDPGTEANISPWRFTVGGVILPNGRPVLLDQMLTLQILAEDSGGVIVYEHIEEYETP